MQTSFSNHFFKAVWLGFAVLFLFSFIRPAQAFCDPVSFLTCRNNFDLQGCIDACPYVDAPCQPGTPANVDCKELDQTCSDGCWDIGTTHGSTCADQAGCSLDDVQRILQGLPLESGEQESEPEPAPEPEKPETEEQAEEPKKEEVPKQEIPEEKVTTFEKAKDERPRPEAVAEIDWTDGEATILITHEDGYEEEIEIGPGDELPPIPKGASIFTDSDTRMSITFKDGSKVHVFPDTEIEFTEWDIERLKEAEAQRLKLREEGRMNLKTGKVKIEVQKGNFQSDMEVATPQNVAAVIGTIFTSAYDDEAKTSYVEVEEGVVEVTSTKTGEVRVLSAEPGGDNRADLDENGFVEVTAFSSTGLSMRNAIVVLAVVIVAGVIFALRKKKKNR